MYVRTSAMIDYTRPRMKKTVRKERRLPSKSKESEEHVGPAVSDRCSDSTHLGNERKFHVDFKNRLKNAFGKKARPRRLRPKEVGHYNYVFAHDTVPPHQKIEMCGIRNYTRTYEII